MNNFLHNFFSTLKKTWGNADFYKQATLETTWKPVRFIIKLSVFLGLVIGSIILIVVLVALPRVKQTVSSHAGSLYPNDLVITVEKGVLSTNTTEPVFIAMPQEWDTDKKFEHLVVISPDEPADIALLEKYNTPVALTSKGAIIMSDKNEVRVLKYDSLDGVLDKQKFLEGIATVSRIGSTIVLIAIIPLSIFFVLSIAFFHLVWVLIVTILVYLFLRKKHNLTYKQCYRMAAYAIVPLMLIEIVAIPLGLTGKLLSTIVVLGIVWYATQKWIPEVAKDITLSENPSI